jgi:hypothetical protein
MFTENIVKIIAIKTGIPHAKRALPVFPLGIILFRKAGLGSASSSVSFEGKIQSIAKKKIFNTGIKNKNTRYRGIPASRNLFMQRNTPAIINGIETSSSKI